MNNSEIKLESKFYTQLKKIKWKRLSKTNQINFFLIMETNLIAITMKLDRHLKMNNHPTFVHLTLPENSID